METSNVTSVMGGKIHLGDPGSPAPFPLCGAGSRNTVTRYRAVDADVTCKECSAILARRVAKESTPMTVVAAPATLGLAGKIAHALESAGSARTRCGKVVSKFLTDEKAMDYPRCTACGASAAGKGTAMPKTETTKEVAEPTRTLGEIKSDVEDIIKGLDAVSDAAKVESMIAAGMDLVAPLRAQSRIPLVKRLEAAQDAAMERLKPEPMAAANAALVEKRNRDLEAVPGSEEIISAGVKKIREGVKLGQKVADVATEIAHIQLEARLRSEYKGLPDLKGLSGPAQAVAKDMYAKARENVDPTEVDVLDAHAALRKAVNNRMGDVVVQFVRSMHQADSAEVFAERFPMLAAKVTDDVSREDVLRAAYKDAEMPLPEHTRAERAKLDRDKTKELPAGAAQGETEAPQAASPVERYVHTAERWAEDADKMAAKARKMEADEKAALKAKVDAALAELAKLSAALS